MARNFGSVCTRDNAPMMSTLGVSYRMYCCCLIQDLHAISVSPSRLRMLMNLWGVWSKKNLVEGMQRIGVCGRREFSGCLSSLVKNAGRSFSVSDFKVNFLRYASIAFWEICDFAGFATVRVFKCNA